MSDQFVGCLVSLEVCGGLGWYQGKVTSVNSSQQTITLTKVIHNGKPATHNEITINAGDIKKLEIVDETKAEIEQKPVKPVSVGKSKKSQTKTMLSKSQSVDLVQNSIPVTQSSYIPTDAKVYVQETVVMRRKVEPAERPRSAAHTPHYREQQHTPSWLYPPRSEYDLTQSPSKYGGGRVGRNQVNHQMRNECTFGTPIDDLIDTEFDFEKNLALFDKQAVFEEITGGRPDVIRHADSKSEKKYRCDENIIPTKPVHKTQIVVPAEGAGEIVYATDNGLLVPSVSRELHASLLSTANQHGLTYSRQLEIIGRGATELILSIIGGSHRLEPGNQHQPPVVVLLCGCHAQGAAGVNTGRQLESFGVKTIVLVPPPATTTPPLLLTHELQLYALTGRRQLHDVRSLPPTIDLIVDARFDHQGLPGDSRTSSSWLVSTTAWGVVSRAPILALDPPSDLISTPSPPAVGPLPSRLLLCPSLPLAYTPARGKLYLLNLPIPLQTFSSVGIKYAPPFGCKLVVPLHPCE